MPLEHQSGGDEVETAVAFGRHRLFPGRRQLFAGDQPVELKPRAFEVLLALAEARGALVPREQLSKRVWPNTFVDPHNLDIQISTLRKALGPDRDMIRTDTGRGWRLLATVETIPPSLQADPPTNLPSPITPLVGREQELAELPDVIGAHRLVTLTGAGGIGKTQLALEAARRILKNFADGAWIVELAPTTDPALVPSAIARALGVAPDSDRSPIDQLVPILELKQLLLLIDNCEHLIEGAAAVAETLLRGAPMLHILATSREPLAAEGEHIFRVKPLTVPATDIRDVAEGLEHSAVRLFVERTQAADYSFVLDEHRMPGVAKICRHLDGIPLALELAAGCVATIGVETLAGRLDDRFRLLTGGRRSALPRHQTLAATLDWSYGLLTPAEQTVLRRIAVFAGSFTLEGARAVAAAGTKGDAAAMTQIAGLVTKSLVALDVRGPETRYRLLDTTRAYARHKLAESGEFGATARRHAAHYRDLLERAEAIWQTTPASELVATYAPDIDDIRAALDWAFAPAGAHELGVALATAAAPLWIQLSMLRECRDLVSRALSHLDEVSGARACHEMRLQAALGISSMWAEGSVSMTRVASERALKLAEDVGSIEYQLRALFIQWTYPLRRGEYRETLTIARKFKQLAETATDLLAELTGIRMEGASLFHLGDLAGARAAMEKVGAMSSPDMRRSFAVRFGIDQRVAALVYLARVLWLQGQPDRAARLAQTALGEARSINNPNVLCMVLCDNLCALAALSGERQVVEEVATTLADEADKHGLGLWHMVAAAFKGVAAVQAGDSALGLRLLRSTLDGPRGTRIELRHTVFVEAFAQALAATGRVAEGRAVIENVLDNSRRNDGLWCVPELLRLRGEFALRDGLPISAAVENRLRGGRLARGPPGRPFLAVACGHESPPGCGRPKGGGPRRW